MTQVEKLVGSLEQRVADPDTTGLAEVGRAVTEKVTPIWTTYDRRLR
jgi:hypothetical protein